MAVNINSLIRTIGGQEKVIDKDKALVELANAIENGGGGGSIVEIKKMWKVEGTQEEPIYTEIQPDLSNIYELNFTGSEISFVATDDDNTPNLSDYSNVILVCTNINMGVYYNKNIGFHSQEYFSDSSTMSIGIGQGGEIGIQITYNQ